VRKSGKGDGGSLFCVIKARVTSANQRGPSISQGEYKAPKRALMNPGVLNPRAVFPGEIPGVNHA
jgi:hypothetical protein